MSRSEPFYWVTNQKGAGYLSEDDVDLKLTGKVALVTGSTAGIGLAIAQSLAREGAHVYVNGRTQQRVDAAIAEIRSHATAAKVDGIAADFSGPAGAEAVIAKLPAVDVLVNNVGIFEPKPFVEIPERHERSAALATLPSGHAEEELGADNFHLERVGRADPGGDGALRDDQNGADRRSARDRRVGGRNRRDGEQRPCRAHGVGRCGRFCRGAGEATEEVEGRGREGVF